eukprot:10297082-Ditylum_brightwellii.AAC.1
MCQAKLGEMLAEGFTMPNKSEDDYEVYQLKDDFLKNHLLTTTLGSNASSFVNIKTIMGLDMYKKLLSVFQGQEYEEDKAVNATAEFEQLKFHRNSRYSPETFLSRVNESLKRMEMDDGQGNTIKPICDALIPSMLRAKIDEPTFETWNGGATQLDTRDTKAFNKACKEGTGVHSRVWKQLSYDKWDKVMKAKEGKGNRKPKSEKDQDGGLCMQCNLNQQLSNLPKGTILVPAKPQAGQNAQLKNTSAMPSTTPTNTTNPVKPHSSCHLELPTECWFSPTPRDPSPRDCCG